MKQIILTIAMVIGVGTFIQAQTTPTEQTEVKTTKETVVQISNDGYKEVKMEALSQKLQTAIKENYSTFTVKSLAYNAEKKLTKVTFTTAEGTQKVVILNEEGKEHEE